MTHGKEDVLLSQPVKHVNECKGV